VPSVEVREEEDVVKGYFNYFKETDTTNHIHNEQDGRRLQAVIQAQQPGSTVDVLVVGKDDAEGGCSNSHLTDASSWEEYEKLFKGLMEPKDKEAGRRLKAMVFMAGVHDEGIMGEVGFGRLLRCCQVRLSACACLCRCSN
jgi:hypothetical protein